MPLGPEELAQIAAIVITAAGGGFGVAKLQSKPASSGNTPEDATLQAIERLGAKVDSVGRQVGQVKLSVEGLAHEVDEAAHALSVLRPEVAQLRERVAGLESRMPPNLRAQ